MKYPSTLGMCKPGLAVVFPYESSDLGGRPGIVGGKRRSVLIAIAIVLRWFRGGSGLIGRGHSQELAAATASQNNFPRLTCAIGFDEKSGSYQVGCFRLLLVRISL